MQKLIASLITASMLIPSVALAGPPRRLMNSNLPESDSRLPLCLDEEDKFTQECDIVIDETGVKGPEGHITNVVQWTSEGEKYNVGGAIVGGVAGTGAGMAAGFGSCLIVGPLCMITAPAIMGAGMGGGVEYGGKSKAKYFTVVGDDKDGDRIIQEFRYPTSRSVKNASKLLLKTTQLVEGELRS